MNLKTSIHKATLGLVWIFPDIQAGYVKLHFEVITSPQASADAG